MLHAVNEPPAGRGVVQAHRAPRPRQAHRAVCGPQVPHEQCHLLVWQREHDRRNELLPASAVMDTASPSPWARSTSSSSSIGAIASGVWMIRGNGYAAARAEVTQRNPSIERSESMVGGRLDDPARRQPHAVHRLHAARERMRERGRNQTETIVERPHRNVARFRRDELTDRHLAFVSARSSIVPAVKTAGFTQVAEHRAFVGAGLEVAAELAQGDDGHLELAGEDLEIPTDLGHLELAVLRVGAAAHQLQVVDEDHAEVAALHLEAPRLGPDLHHRDTRVVVELERHFEPPDRPPDASPVGLRQLAVSDLRGVDLGLARQDALRQLDVTHLEREHQHRPTRRLGDVCRHAEPERGLAHRRSGPDDVERRGLQTGEHSSRSE